MNQIEIVSRLAVQHLACPLCGALPGETCRILKRDGGLIGNLFAGLTRVVPHQLRRDPFIEAWTDGYITAEDESIQAHP